MGHFFTKASLIRAKNSQKGPKHLCWAQQTFSSWQIPYLLILVAEKVQSCPRQNKNQRTPIKTRPCHFFPRDPSSRNAGSEGREAGGHEGRGRRGEGEERGKAAPRTLRRGETGEAQMAESWGQFHENKLSVCLLST